MDDKEVYTFPKSIDTNVGVIERLEFDLVF